MLLSWFKNRRRRKILAAPFPAAWLDVLRQNVGHYAWLDEAERAKLRRAVQIFLAETEFEGCRGLKITDQTRVTIAGSACLLVLGFDDYYFDDVQTVLVYPRAFRIRGQEVLAGEAVVEGETSTLGVLHHRGPIALNWALVKRNAREPGQRRDAPGHGENLVFHEFAHQLDMRNGAFDGTPDLADEALRRRWARVMDDEYNRLVRAADRGRRTFLDPYGATDPAEFFAVVTETFFDLPWEMRRRHPELYGLLRDYFRQDPAAWPEPPDADD
jgi:Mlc titration factor MtfA (ptsG expression regulator)